MRPKITQRGFRLGAEGTAHVLGHLEEAVVELLWAQPSQTVNDVETRLRRRREIAHTTVLTTLDRMYRKGYLTREKRGRAFVYTPRYSPKEFQRGMACEVLGALLRHSSESAISTFVDLVAKNPDSFHQLEALVREKRGKRSQQRRGGVRPNEDDG